jgi:hypothetical protein
VGSAFVRLLARMTDGAVPGSPQGFAQRLGQWVGWTDAISLSAALNAGASPVAAVPQRRGAAAPLRGLERETQGLREALARSIADDAALKADTEFLPFRRHYNARQQAMEIALAPLRERLRATLAATSAAPLAALDTAMAEVLAGQERRLFSAVPVVLEQHFERLRAASAMTEPPPGHPAAASAPAPWVAAFRRDLRELLLAELDLRLQPVEGLLEALRTALPADTLPASPVTPL